MYFTAVSVGKCPALRTGHDSDKYPRPKKKKKNRITLPGQQQGWRGNSLSQAHVDWQKVTHSKGTCQHKYWKARLKEHTTVSLALAGPGQGNQRFRATLYCPGGTLDMNEQTNRHWEVRFPG